MFMFILNVWEILKPQISIIWRKFRLQSESEDVDFNNLYETLLKKETVPDEA